MYDLGCKPNVVYRFLTLWFVYAIHSNACGFSLFNHLLASCIYNALSCLIIEVRRRAHAVQIHRQHKLSYTQGCAVASVTLLWECLFCYLSSCDMDKLYLFKRLFIASNPTPSSQIIITLYNYTHNTLYSVYIRQIKRFNQKNI